MTPCLHCKFEHSKLLKVFMMILNIQHLRKCINVSVVLYMTPADLERYTYQCSGSYTSHDII